MLLLGYIDMIVTLDVLVDPFQHYRLFLNRSFREFYHFGLDLRFWREIALNFIAFEERLIVYVTSIVDLQFLIVGLLLKNTIVPVIPFI